MVATWIPETLIVFGILGGAVSTVFFTGVMLDYILHRKRKK